MRYGSGSRRVPGASSKLRNVRREVVTVGHPSRQAERMSTDEAQYSRSTPAAPSPIFITNQDAVATGAAAAAEDSGYPLSEAAYGLSERATQRQANSSMLFGTQRVTRDDFIPVKTIGKGSFAKVLLVRKRDTGTHHGRAVDPGECAPPVHRGAAVRLSDRGAAVFGAGLLCGRRAIFPPETRGTLSGVDGAHFHGGDHLGAGAPARAQHHLPRPEARECVVGSGWTRAAGRLWPVQIVGARQPKGDDLRGHRGVSGAGGDHQPGSFVCG
eukprot:ctg_390.g209